MATYAEILTASINNTLRDKTIVAVCMAAEVIRNEDIATANHTARLAWSKAALADPENAAKPILRSMLVQTQTATPTVTLAQLTGATDAAVLAATLAAVNSVA
jgi:hypothetical protein